MYGVEQLTLNRIARGMSPLLVDALLGLAVTLTVSLVITADVAGSGRDPAAYLWAAGLGALMLLRRRYPVLVVALSIAGLVAYYAADYPPIGVAVPVAAAVFSAAELGRLRPAVLGSVVVVVVSTTYRLMAGQDPSFVLGYELVEYVLLLAAAVALGDSLRSRREAHDRAGEVAALLAERYGQETDARVTAERLAISRDLHDSLGHANAVVALHAQVATEALGHDDAAARQALEVISSTTAATMTELRRTVAALRHGVHEPRETVHLRDLEAAVRPARQAGIDVVIDVMLSPSLLPAVVEMAAYRIVQESIVNVARHSAASRVRVEVHERDEVVHVRVVDDGPPLTPEPEQGPNQPVGHGITGMRERAEALGGGLTAGRTADGFEVRATLPLAVPQ
jgi:signal transduction histidine kinase